MNLNLLAFALAQILDIQTTCIALHQGKVETNPFLPQTCPGIAATKGAIGTGGVLVLYQLHRQHPKWAWGLSLAASGATGYAVIRNLQEIRK